MRNPPLDILDKGDELDRARANRIRRAEKSDKISHGAAMLQTDGGTFEEIFIDVTFYPTKQWWLYRNKLKDREPLTPEIYARVKKLSL